MFDYETLRFIWWILLLIVCISFALTDGFDMGVGALLRVIGKTDIQRRVMINSIAPHWDGNQVWLIVIGGGMFAAWPTVYSAAFSGFYTAMILVLASLFFRPIGFDYRSKISNITWRNMWDWGIVIGSVVPPFIFGLILGNLIQGVPFTIDEWMNIKYFGNIFSLFNPLGLLSGILALCMIILHGSTFLVLRTEGTIQCRALYLIKVFGIITTLLFLISGVIVLTKTDGYILTSIMDHASPSNPLRKTVSKLPDAWLNNYYETPILWLLPLIGLIMPIFSIMASYFNYYRLAFAASSLSILGIIGTPAIAMFPFLMPSSINPNVSLTLWDGSSSQSTLQIMAIIAAIMIPLILMYTSWCYYKMFFTFNENTIIENDHSLY